ncbi:hypothetical protein GCM10010096_17750 [Alcaligenes pakistanensis]|uniref:Uncharacterized protein n=1 Tax=Alcaligenes pakistanensis TaxID=1482717 RepID=A0A8H9IPP9_9BURK|nr:hypothetical protein [Alcaligenes pakistanensis]MBP6621694.1 hypothetical protein [Alcaligenes sp.]GHC46738.1 hypothetical protein GCM10010096_17750 [Alcaligenes pakistanensis]
MPAADKQAMLEGLGGLLQQARSGVDTCMSDHGSDWWQQILNLDHGMNQPDGRSAMPQVVADMAQWLIQAGLRNP